ncbi:protein asteroid [Calliphora vicina]|uniref:protein asteroid n=1 Tax=Calliphora vicina TaxID=7373 RepID=UPI00325A85BC
MGVRGLTGFIARNAELYLTPYELHDCNLVIDGDNLACNLYKDVTGNYSAFGGDYDDFYRAVVNFFVVLAECNIKAYVLMDGGYEQRKLRTVGKRMRGKISVIKRINPCASITVFPVMMKEVFVDAVKDCGVPVMRCVFEADDELAALSRKLKCPVLSYDSDFYIHNVKYIPLITLTVKAHTKLCRSNIIENPEEETRKLRKNEAKKVDKRTRGNRIMDAIVVDNKEKPKKGKSYKYLDCCMYRIENLIARGSLSKEKLPLFAAMLGNDYISRSCFKNFFQSGMGKVGRSRKTKQQQRRIKVILQWLKTETAESALEKIMTRLQTSQRESLMAQMEAATSGYSNEKCRSYDFFINKYENVFEDFINADDDDEIYETEEEEESDEEEEEEEEEEENTSNIEEEIVEKIEEEEYVESDDLQETVEQEEKDVEKKENSSKSASEDSENEEESNEDTNDIISSFPQWFLDKLYPANLPRFFVDFVHLRKYINNPQIEHFPYSECNGIALPILTLSYSLLNNVKGNEFVPKLMEDGTLRPLFFTYLTRATRVTNIRYEHVEVDQKSKYDFEPENPNPLFLKEVFEKNMHELNADELFAELDKLPKDIRLYFMAIVYWLQKSQHYDVEHVHALIVCLVVLRTIDSKIPAERDLKAFQKKFGKIIKKERQVRDKDEANGTKRVIKDEVLALPIPDRLAYIPKSDCYLVQNELLKHFHMQDIFKKKYDMYSSIILHAFAEFQAVVFQLHSLNALLDFPYEPPRMGQSYCGVFLYNLYDLFKNRLDTEYYIKNFIFRDSQMMFDLYLYLWRWCEKFIPSWKQPKDQNVKPTLSKKILKKKRQLARKNAAQEITVQDPNADMLSSAGETNDEFLDLNNKFCTFLKVS